MSGAIERRSGDASCCSAWCWGPILPVVNNDFVSFDDPYYATAIVGEMVAADGKRVAVAAENKHVQIRPRKRNAAGKRQRASVDEMHPVRLHKIREPARTADARDADKIIVLEFALFDELEIQRQHREIAATGTPRRVIGGEFLFRQRPCARNRAARRRDGNPALRNAGANFGNGFAHKNYGL